MTEWRTVASADDYEVSDLGEIRRRTPHRQPHRTWPGRVLKPAKHTGGYRFVRVVPSGGVEQVQFYVHRIVARAFLGECPEGCEINHKNGNKADNRAENLEWISHLENVRHAVRTGLSRPGTGPNRVRGERHPDARLTDEQVLTLRAERDGGAPVSVLSRRYGIGLASTWAVVKSRTWKDLPPCKKPLPDRWTIHIEEAKRLRAEGWTLQRIGERFGVTQNAVIRAFARIGLHTPKAQWQFDVARAVELGRDGLSYAEIGRLLGTHWSNVRRACQRARARKESA